VKPVSKKIFKHQSNLLRSLVELSTDVVRRNFIWSFALPGVDLRVSITLAYFVARGFGEIANSKSTDPIFGEIVKLLGRRRLCCGMSHKICTS
jgi:hypothetical protein